MSHDAKEHLLSKIIQAVLVNIPLDEHIVFKDFVPHFIHHSHYKDLKRLNFQQLVTGITELWDFIKQRSSDTPKIKVYYWRPVENSIVSDRLIIDIVNDDMPFLVDSLIELLAKYNLKARRLWHPILKVQRDTQGVLKYISSLAQEAEESWNYESIIHCEIVEGANPELISTLQQEIENVLHQVRLATQDWQKMRTKTDAIMNELQENNFYSKDSHVFLSHFEEALKFLKWVKEDHFTYLGYGFFNLTSDEGKIIRQSTCHDPLGILGEKSLQDFTVLFKGIAFNSQARKYLFDKSPVIINKASLVSQVHRGSSLDVIGIKRFNSQNQVIGIHFFLGLFTLTAYDSSTKDIPLLRRKVEVILKNAGLSSNWHDGKTLVHILDSFPRDDLFQASIEELTKISTSILYLEDLNRVLFFIRHDQFNRFLSCLIYIPRDRFNTELCDQISVILSEELKAHLGPYKVQLGSLSLARVHYIAYVEDTIIQHFDHKAIEQKLTLAARSWGDHLRVHLSEIYDDYLTSKIYKKFKSAFSKGYQERYQIQEVVQDIHMLQHLQENPELKARFYAIEEPTGKSLKFKVYHPNTAVPLSNILPILENLDLKITKEFSFKIKFEAQDQIYWIHDFELNDINFSNFDIEQDSDRFLEAFYAIYKGQVEDDGFNKFVLHAGLTKHHCLLLRTYNKYLRQICFPFSRDYIEQSLLKHSSLTAKIISYFEQKFDPEIAIDNEDLKKDILHNLEKIKNPDEDKILRSYFNLVIASLRTNYYQNCRVLPYDQRQNCENSNSIKSYLSIKFDSCLIDEMPLPRPMYEIFVYSPTFEGIHLRGGKVARGGIRWSDRLEDFRTEILSLVKAQMVKNTVIVPVGSKGGFVVKSRLSNSLKDEIVAEGIECYQNFMRALLDITDNLQEAQIIKPPNVVCWDGDDPYLVVAADKGTATFSDIANAISQDYKFWLDDAFASGGSVGYDHKKMAITARGAWESVTRHFLEINLDIQTTPFTVIGVGDMAGDVFGNGMLLSKNIKLIGAFNHQHIFIDPSPNPIKSFAERQRLFQLSRSSWQDYDINSLSSGGRIFDRYAKVLTISLEIQQMFNLPSVEVTPVNLIKALLMHSVDLLWFGGIGTFVKSSDEAHADVNDRNNDLIRVNAAELRCCVIAEGANLGVTQRGRIEFARRGGRINTDAIDNSAGVDCSDHEVNLKILLNNLVRQNQLSIEDRNKMLMDMTKEVAQKVLQDNYDQNLAISLIEVQGAKLLDEQIKLVRYLEWRGKLNRVIEYLPDDSDFAEMLEMQKGWTRPEIAVILAYAKIDYYEEILDSSLLKDSFFERELKCYFPSLIQKYYPDEILSHPLRSEIIATILTNDLVNRLGPSYLYDLINRIGCRLEDGFQVYFLIKEVFKLSDLWRSIEECDREILPSSQFVLMLDIQNIVKRIMSWILRYYSTHLSLDSLINILKSGTEIILTQLKSFLNASSQEDLDIKIKKYVDLNIRHEIAEKVAVLRMAASSPDIILISTHTQFSISDVARLYFEVGSRFSFSLLRTSTDQIKAISSWQRMALNGAVEDLYLLQSELVEEILINCNQEKREVDQALSYWILQHQDRIERIDRIIQEVLSLNLIDLAAISIIIREVRCIIKTLNPYKI